MKTADVGSEQFGEFSEPTLIKFIIVEFLDAFKSDSEQVNEILDIVRKRAKDIEPEEVPGLVARAFRLMAMTHDLEKYEKI